MEILHRNSKAPWKMIRCNKVKFSRRNGIAEIEYVINGFSNEYLINGFSNEYVINGFTHEEIIELIGEIACHYNYNVIKYLYFYCINIIYYVITATILPLYLFMYTILYL